MNRKIKTIFLMLILIVIGCNRSSNTKNTKNQLRYINFIPNFEKELSELKSDEISTLNKATDLFKDYISKSHNNSQKDSLFMPYFNHYNLGRVLLKNEAENIINNYGFKKIQKEEKEYLVPVQSDYLEANVITYLSEPMKKFCRQQLKEFNDSEDLETIASNALWWEKFNAENPNFFLKEMTNYHYKNWHLKNLISGTRTVKVFRENDKLTDQAETVYLRIVANNPESDTAKIIKEYLVLLEKNNMTRSGGVQEFINNYK
ncbi:hypothetical protein [Winogradskyella flava]|uniref:hypothetical protein n=1 Tax=Winogradskyella flava TaxID=1884876 RepID=UPI002490CBD8|nr:hypothetical protein [Winogradskyella flava]